MTTPYINPNLIFAENAPTQDKPAAFSNYDKGMDETRKNDGRPTIKQFNFLQQQNDLKNRYIHENGAALPYKEGIAYEENAVVVKDGVLQQWKAGAWAGVVEWSSIENKPDLYTKTESDTLFIEASQIGQPNGVAGLDGNGDLDSALFPKATETSLGVVELATQTEVNTGTDTERAVTPATLKSALNTQINTALNASGDAPMFACRAWVNFDGAGVLAIRGSGNVTSVTDDAIGLYTINFATAMSDANYAVALTRNSGGGANIGAFLIRSSSDAASPAELKTANALRVISQDLIGNQLRAADIADASVVIYQ